MKCVMFAALAGVAAASKLAMKPVQTEYVGEVKEALAGVIHFDRTINTLTGATGKVTLDKDCTGSDAYGSNDCDLHWGDTITITYNLALQTDIEAGAKIQIDAKLDNIVPFKAECAACGAKCDITIPIIKKDISFDMPACPISATSLSNTTTLTLPATSPIPISISGKGKLTVIDATGKTIADVDVNVDLK